MATNKTLRVPQIIEIDNGIIRIAHPEISNNLRAYLRNSISAGATAMTVSDNNGFADDDFFIIGVPGEETTEACDVNGAVTRGQSITATNTLAFSHEMNAPVTKIFERSITLYGAPTDGGALVAIRATTGAVNIQWNKPYTEIPLITTDTVYAYYVAKFYDGTTQSDASAYVPSSGYSNNSVGQVVQDAIDMADVKMDSDLFKKEKLIRFVNDAQNEILSYKYQDPRTGNYITKDWSFELADDDITVVANKTSYAFGNSTELTYVPKNGYSEKSIISVKFRDEKPMEQYKDIREWEEDTYNLKETTIGSIGVVGAVTLTVADNTDLSDTGSVVVNENTITYTGKTGTTTLTGVPASGTGSIDYAHAVGAIVYQGGVSPYSPTKYTVYAQELKLNVPFKYDYEGFKFHIKYLKKLNALSKYSDTIVIPFAFIMQYFVAYKIELVKGNTDQADYYYKKFRDLLLEQALADYLPVTDYSTYYNFEQQD